MNTVDLIVEIDVQRDDQCCLNAVDLDPDLMADQQWHQWFETWIGALQPNLSPINAYALGLRLTDDARMQHFNATFRHIDQPTDVLAFASLECEALPPEIWDSQPLELGDIIISVETAHRQAQEQQHSLTQEILWLASHGLLHLLGWDHPTSVQLNEMLLEQQKLLSQVGLLYEVKNCIYKDIKANL